MEDQDASMFFEEEGEGEGKRPGDGTAARRG
jgi:hypothetical protein